ncbi:MAG: hypothetical protein ABI227_00135 [Rhodanobacter sp.]
MRISKDMMIAGASAAKLRDALRWYERSSFWSAESLAARIGVGTSEGHDIAARLLEEGYIEVKHSHDDVDYYAATLKGGALSLASAAKPIKRATAERLVAGVIHSAEAVNSNDDYLYRVAKLSAFGSYLTDAPTLGDVDLVVELTPRHSGGECDPDALMEYADEAEAAGKRFSSFFDRLAWPTEEILRLLKGSSKAISIHSPTDRVLVSATTRVLYEHR